MVRVLLENSRCSPFLVTIYSTRLHCCLTTGCGVHIHSGTNCSSTELQEGHYFVDPVLQDPWTEDRYTSDGNGRATYAGIVNMGTVDIDGRAFIGTSLLRT